MNQLTISLIVFSGVWILTFFPAWRLLLRLLALSASPSGQTWVFWTILVSYRIVIALPYVALLLLGADVLSDIFEIIVVGLIVIGTLLSVIRFGFRERIIDWLWWVYGFFYDGLIHYAPYRRLITAVVEKAHDEKPLARSIVELGCGTGNVLVALATKYPGVPLCGVDNSSTMLRGARKKSKAIIIQDDVIGYLLKQSEGAHDLIIMQNILYAISDRKTLWNEIHRVLTPSGVVVITNSDRAGSSSITKEHLIYGKWYELLHPKLLCVGVIDALISQLSKTGSFSFIEESVIRLEVEPIFSMSSATRVYGDVNILFTLHKQDIYE